MLTKKQLEDAAECNNSMICSKCSIPDCNIFKDKLDCISGLAKTALAYREMLERARKTLQDAWEDDGSAVIGNQILETINAIDALLGGEKDA